MPAIASTLIGGLLGPMVNQVGQNVADKVMPQDQHDFFGGSVSSKEACGLDNPKHHINLLGQQHSGRTIIADGRDRRDRHVHRISNIRSHYGRGRNEITGFGGEVGVPIIGPGVGRKATKKRGGNINSTQAQTINVPLNDISSGPLP